MYEFTVRNKKTGKELILYGYSFSSALETLGDKADEYEYIMHEYID